MGWAKGPGLLSRSRRRNNDARKRAITLEQLLTMSSGLKWSDDANNGEMDQSQDAVNTFSIDRWRTPPGRYSRITPALRLS